MAYFGGSQGEIKHANTQEIVHHAHFVVHDVLFWIIAFLPLSLGIYSGNYAGYVYRVSYPNIRAQKKEVVKAMLLQDP